MSGSGLAALLARRRMVRDFDPGAGVPVELLEAVLDAGLTAPSAGHAQVVTAVVLADQQVSGFWSVTSEPGADSAWLRGMRRAPVLITLWTSEDAYAERYAEPDKAAGSDDGPAWSAPWWWVDAGMTAMAVLLAATDAGLGACFFGVPPRRQALLAEHLGVPAGWASAGVVALGRPAAADRPSGSGRRRARRPREERIRSGRW
ncbi:nitroreductase family protein [Auraticoccus monumenti]|uniref:Nitroreductase n=1 Tax=Auraticoccus monumenti TaxID=675864 RepID=A0A1G6YMZ9_9ACTN|nr:nitroreductase family protein [Auraticoccus monumenti]SDD91894.1 Nitroreductase [Auraticoccus monumenti]